MNHMKDLCFFLSTCRILTHIYTYAGSVMGIVGYGDIGVACAKLAKAFGMRIVTLRRRPELNAGDPYVDHVRLDMCILYILNCIWYYHIRPLLLSSFYYTITSSVCIPRPIILTSWTRWWRRPIIWSSPRLWRQRREGWLVEDRWLIRSRARCLLT